VGALQGPVDDPNAPDNLDNVEAKRPRSTICRDEFASQALCLLQRGVECLMHRREFGILHALPMAHDGKGAYLRWGFDDLAIGHFIAP
jgi:hypothetical protein